MTEQSKDVARYERYAQVVKAARAKDRFTMAEIKQTCSWENPAFVTRVIHTLERDAMLKREPACSAFDEESTVKSHRKVPKYFCGDSKGEEQSKPLRYELAEKKSASQGGTRKNIVREDVMQWLVDPQQFSTTQWLDQRVVGHCLRRLPEGERPRERLLSQGPAALRTAELLAILIRIGRPGESALEAGEAVARRFADCLGNLPQAGRGELRAITAAVGKTAFCQIAAGAELGKRIAKARANEEKVPLPPRLNSPEAAIAYCRDCFGQLIQGGAQEEFHVVTLDTKLRPLDSHRVSLGLLDQAMIHPREVFRHAIQDAAKAVLLVHNHPSGDPEPSAADLSATRQLEEAGQVIGIEVIDHLVVAREGVVSLRQRRKEG